MMMREWVILDQTHAHAHAHILMQMYTNSQTHAEKEQKKQLRLKAGPTHPAAAEVSVPGDGTGPCEPGAE